MSPPDQVTAIREYLHQGADVLHATAEACAEDISKAVDLLVECYRNDGKVLLCGNGGSAAQCQHLAAELVNLLSRDRTRPALAAVALTTDTSVLTAIANDFGFDQVFARQVEALGKPGDVLVAISTSGKSANVLRAMTRARSAGLVTILLTGESGGDGLQHAQVAIRVGNHGAQRVQEVHSAIGHILCGEVERALFG
jgi:D-sedoheptulose 7-phosphate isomerase